MMGTIYKQKAHKGPSSFHGTGYRYSMQKRLWKNSILNFSVSGFSFYIGGTRQVIHSLKQQIFLLLFRQTNCNRVSVNIRRTIWEVAVQSREQLLGREIVILGLWLTSPLG